MTKHRSHRGWSDGDTYLVLALLVAACGVAILWHASNPDNWLVLGGSVWTPLRNWSR